MRNFTIINIAVFIVFLFTETISAQIVISTPNLGFSQACASPTFNTYNVTFSFSPESGLNSSNQFIIRYQMRMVIFPVLQQSIHQRQVR